MAQSKTAKPSLLVAQSRPSSHLVFAIGAVYDRQAVTVSNLPVAQSLKDHQAVTVSLPVVQSKTAKSSSCLCQWRIQRPPSRLTECLISQWRRRQAGTVSNLPVAHENITKPSQCLCQWRSHKSSSRYSVFASGAIKDHQAVTDSLPVAQSKITKPSQTLCQWRSHRP